VGLGLLLVGLLVWHVGVQAVATHLLLLGWGMLAVLCVSFAWKCSGTFAWILAFPPNVARPGFWRLFSVSLAGDVVNSILPTANLGGEVAKPYLLRSEIPASASFPSVVAHKTMELVSGLVFAAFGAGMAILVLPMGDRLRLGLAIAIGVGGVAIGLLCLAQRRNPCSMAFRVLRRLRVFRRYLDRYADQADRVDAGLSAFYSKHRSRFWGCLGLRLGSWVLGTFEAYLILRLMDAGTGLETALLLVALPLMIDTAFFFVPANLGTSEAGHTYVSVLLALNPAVGLSLALVKRFRRLFWIAVGLVLLHTQFGRAGLKPERAGTEAAVT
jgi:uncharacterized protein (TIRG00374 family)